MDKNSIRRIYKELRKSVEDRHRKERDILRGVMSVIVGKKSVFIYQSIGGEVSTSEIISAIYDNFDVYVPEVIGQDMALKNLKTGEYRLSPCDITIVPLIAFDQTLNRIGFGGGYYDRYLSKNKTFAVGIAFDEQQCEPFDKESTDIPLNMIITPTRILRLL